MPDTDTIVVIPAFNEAPNLPGVLAGVRAHTPGADVLVVDDGSTDATAEIARDAGARCLSLSFNLGIGAALEAGYRYAHRAGYRYVARVDGDGQHEPEDIGALLGPIRAGEADFVGGSRFLDGRSGRVTTVPRRFGIGFFSRLVSLFTGRKVTDPTSGFYAFNRDVLAAFVREFPTDFPEVETLLYLHRLGFHAIEVPVRFHPRRAGRSSITFFRSLYYMYKVTFALLILTVRDYPSGPAAGGPVR